MFQHCLLGKNAFMDLDGITIRELREDDLIQTAQVFFDAVQFGTTQHYSQRQKNAWAPDVPELGTWRERLLSQTVVVAELDGKIIGFMTLKSDGCIDLAFVAPEFMGQGVATKLYASVLLSANSSGIDKLVTEASYLARPFFERQGWSVKREQTKFINDVELVNFLMEKNLEP